jgi:hypothetical protein
MAADLATAVTLASTAVFMSRRAARSVASSRLSLGPVEFDRVDAWRRTIWTAGSAGWSSQKRRSAAHVYIAVSEPMIVVASGWSEVRVQLRSVVELTPERRASAARLSTSSAPGSSIGVSIKCAQVSSKSSHMCAYVTP